MKFITSKEIFEKVYSKSNSVIDNNDDKFVAFMDNHFEVVLTKDDRVYREIRLSTLSINANVLSGNIDLTVYSTKAVLNTLSEFHKNDKINLLYVMYNSDGSDKFEVFNSEVTLNDIVFEASYNSKNSNTLIMKFTL